EGPFDAVLANLPYVPDGVELQPEIARYEPAAALYAGPDGLDAFRRLITMLDGAPLLALEVGAAQGPSVRPLLDRAGFRSIQTRLDLAGYERVVVARR
ncbi:MAG TPA: hypothetical protein VMP89_20445, partial [Solirubrobacteraceae bacterium]|nr:hypothetical protein [Solirubrobacteraceae bacterium]